MNMCLSCSSAQHRRDTGKTTGEGERTRRQAMSTQKSEVKSGTMNAVAVS